MNQGNVAYYSRRIDQSRAAATAATCDAARQAHEVIAIIYEKRLAVVSEVEVKPSRMPGLTGISSPAHADMPSA